MSIILGGGRYLVTDRRTNPKLTIGVLSLKNADPTDANANLAIGEIRYYNNKIYGVYLKTDNTLQAFELINSDSLANYIAAQAKQEKLRFALYPFEGKDNWFLFNGIAAPTLIGYQFRVVSMKGYVVNTSAINLTNNSIVDYMGSLSSAVVALGSAATALVVEHLLNLPMASNAILGVFFNGKVSGTNKRKVKLMVNNGSIAEIDFEAEGQVQDSGSGSPLNKLYIIEVTIQNDTSPLINQNQN